MRWLLITLAAFVVFNGLRGWLEKIGLGRLPGDFTLRVRGREWYFPFGSAVLLSLLAALIARWL
ncbi:MAG: DUF2905 domain-containing protein [Burkholderiaceae bacterium]|nr:DUF2905 domain-containing protein [Burkholderiaceae bacterium]